MTGPTHTPRPPPTRAPLCARAKDLEAIKMPEYLITNIEYSNLKDDGSPLVTKAGKPLWRAKIQIPERPGIWIRGLCFIEPHDWLNTKRDLQLYRENYNGVDYPKFKLATKSAGGLQLQVLQEILQVLHSIDARLAELLSRAPVP
jgi:hypothetical protein